jgi:hypothetical protein
MSLHVSARNGPSSGNQSNTAKNQTSHVCTQPTWSKRVENLECKHLFLEFLYKYDWWWYTCPWKQPTYLMKSAQYFQVWRLYPSHCISRSITFTELYKKYLHFNYPTLYTTSAVCKSDWFGFMLCSFVWFPDDGPLWAKTCRDIQCECDLCLTMYHRW